MYVLTKKSILEDFLSSLVSTYCLILFVLYKFGHVCTYVHEGVELTRIEHT